MLMKVRGTFIQFSPVEEPKGQQRARSTPAPCGYQRETANQENYLSSLSRFVGVPEDVGAPSSSATLGSLPFLRLETGKEDPESKHRDLTESTLPEVESESVSTLPEFAAEDMQALSVNSLLPISVTPTVESLSSLSDTEEEEEEATSTPAAPAVDTPTSAHCCQLRGAATARETPTAQATASSDRVALTVGYKAAVISLDGALANAGDFAVLRQAISYCNSHREAISVVFLWFASDQEGVMASPHFHGLAKEASKDLLELAQPVVGLVAASLATSDTLLLSSCTQVIAVHDAKFHVENYGQILCLSASQAKELGLVGRLVDHVQELTDDFWELQESCSSGATSLMLCNLPCRMTQRQLEEALVLLGYSDSYDCIFFPSSKGSPNLGYVFVNFVSVQIAAKFAASFHRYQFEGSRSTKRAQVKIANVQGRTAMIEKLNWRAVKNAAAQRSAARKARQ